MRNILTILLFSLISYLNADIKSNQGTLKFDINSDGQAEMLLNTNGLGIGSTTPSSNLEVYGTYGYGITTVTGNADLSTAQSTIIVNSPESNSILSLPDPTNINGRVYTIKHASGNTYSTLTSSANIDGQPYLALKPIPYSRVHPFVKVISDGTTWNIIDYHNQTLNDIAASDNLVIWWSFDDSPSTVFEDSSSHNNDGIIDGSADYVQVNGKIGYAVQGQNTRQNLLSLTHNSTTELDSVSAGFWIKATADASNSFGNYASVLTKMNINTRGWQIDWNNLGAVPRRIRTRTDSSTSDTNNVTSNIDVFDGSWQHVAYTASEGTINFYVDGTFSSTRSYDTGAGNTISTTQNIVLTLEPDLFIDEVRVYSKALSAEEISQWYNE